MKFIKGRSNLSATVYVPYNCTNNCSFCSSKQEYEKGVDIDKIKEQLHKVRNSSIKEVVFTGGEPMTDCKLLSELIEIVDNKDVYINTSLVKTDVATFINLINKTKCIKGINISRHSTCYTYDTNVLNNIADDCILEFIKKPIKINVVIPKDADLSFFKSVCKRWINVNADIKVCFRANFNDINTMALHLLNDITLKNMLTFGEYIDRSYCDVCDTTNMKFTLITGKEMVFSYHKGLSTTSIELGHTIQVNDIIIFPNGELCYDWNRKDYNIGEMEEEFGFNKVESKKMILEPKYQSVNIGSCGSGGHNNCGGRNTTRTINYGSCGGSSLSRC